MKPEFIVGSEKRFADFISNLDENDKIAILTHNDLDGLASAVIASKVLGKIDYIAFASYAIGEFKDILEQLKNKKINKIIFTDLSLDNEVCYIKEMEKFAEILIIDHHPFQHDLNSEKTVFIKSKSEYPATAMCYYLFSKIQKIDSWIAAIGIIADLPHKYGEKNSEQVYDDFEMENKHKNENEIWQFIKISALALIYLRKKEKEFYEILMKSKKIGDLVELEKYASLVEREFEKFKEDFEKNKEVYGDMIVYYFKPKYSINSLLVNEISCSHPNNTLIFIIDMDDSLSISARRQDRKVDVNNFLKSAIVGIPNSSAGGHAAASGGTVPRQYLNQFKENLIRNSSI